MKTTKEYTDDHQVKITAEFETDLLEQYKRRAARKIAKNTRIPGFRPGKAPYQMVLNHVGEASVLQEAIDILLEEEYPKILDQEEITPWGPGNLEKIVSYDPPVFEFVVPLDAEVTLVGDDKLNKEYAPEPVLDEEIEKEIENIQRNYANLVPVERPAQEDDVVYLTLEGVDLNPAEGEDPIVVKETPQQILIDQEGKSRESEWPFQGFAREFIGKTLGKFEIEHTFPEDAKDEDFAGKQIRFSVDVQEIKALELPELDEELLSQIGDYETEEALREDIRKSLETRKNTEYDDKYFTDLVDELRANSTIKYCPQMLQEAEEDMLHRVEHSLSHQGLDLELFLKLTKMDKDAYIEKEIRPRAKDRLERTLIMDALTKKHDIEIDHESLEKEIQNVIGQMIQSGSLEKAQKDMGAKKFAQNISMEAYHRAMGAAQFKLLKVLADPDIVEVKPPKLKIKVKGGSKQETEAETAPEAESENEAEPKPIEEPEDVASEEAKDKE